MTILAAQQMFEALKHDWKEANDPIKNPSHHVGNINLDTYKKKFNVSDDEIKAYCATLTPLQLKYPNCVMCGWKWDWEDDDEIKPVNNGHIIRGVDYIETFCPNENHDTLWHYEDPNGNCSFDREIEDLNGYSFSLRYNCSCMVPECFQKNVIMVDVYEGGYVNYKTIKYFDPPLPYDISREDIWKLVEPMMLLL